MRRRHREGRRFGDGERGSASAGRDRSRERRVLGREQISTAGVEERTERQDRRRNGGSGERNSEVARCGGVRRGDAGTAAGRGQAGPPELSPSGRRRCGGPLSFSFPIFFSLSLSHVTRCNCPFTFTFYLFLFRRPKEEKPRKATPLKSYVHTLLWAKTKCNLFCEYFI